MLEQLLEKPESYRKNVAIFATFVISVAVVSVWLLIAGYNIRESTFAIINSGNSTAEDFRNSLPSIRQEGDTVVTELSKQNMAASVSGLGDQKETTEKKSVWDKFLGR